MNSKIEAQRVRLTTALNVARMALEQSNGLDIRTAANGPTVREVIDRALEWDDGVGVIETEFINGQPVKQWRPKP